MSVQSSTEPNLADAIRLIEESDFEKSKVSHWCCSIRAIAAALGLPPESVPARWQAIAHRVKQLHHARVGMAEKTLKNHIANLKAALRHLSGDRTISARGTPLTPEWLELRKLINHEMNRYHLTGLMRFASRQGISPEAVDDAVHDDPKTQTNCPSSGAVDEFQMAVGPRRRSQGEGWPRNAPTRC